MAAFNKFDSFIYNLGLGNINLSTDDIRIYLTNVAPDGATMEDKFDLTEIAAGNGYTAGGADVAGTWSTAGVFEGANSVQWTATGGAIAQFRYAVLFDNTPAADADKYLIGWWDYGAAVDVATGETFTVDLNDANIFTIS